MSDKKKVGGNRQNQRTISKREQQGTCKYCGKTFTRLMFPGPDPTICDACKPHQKKLRKIAARERMRRRRGYYEKRGLVAPTNISSILNKENKK